jgi:hypothetical protein
VIFRSGTSSSFVFRFLRSASAKNEIQIKWQVPFFQIVQSIWVLGLRANYVNDWGNAALSDRLVNNVLTFIKQIIEREHL